MRWKCTCAYDGTTFAGWQSQAGGVAIQDAVEARLAAILHAPVRIHGSGRTDAGVHAHGQVFHFDADWRHGADKLLAAFRTGLPPGIQDLLANRLDLGVISTSLAAHHVKAGRLKAIALAGLKRHDDLPNVPTLKELGYDVEYYLWVGVFGVKGTPAPAITTMREAINKAAHTEQYKTALANLGQELGYLDQPEFAKFWAEDTKRIEDAIRTIGRVDS